MKKSLLALAALSTFAGVANAQSTVTLYGLIDAGITYTNNSGGHARWAETSGSVNSSRWGLKGAEDLGGGLKAIFQLENGFGINDGTLKQGGREFGRQAFVGLSSDQFGAVTLGRQYDQLNQYLGPLSLTGTQYGGTQFAHPFDNDNLNNSFRVNNSISYQSVNYAGFKLGAQYGFSNAAGSQFSNNRAYSFGASYSFAGLNFAAAYLQLNNNTNAAFNGSGAVTDDATFAASRQRTYGAGVNYTFGPATAGFVFTQTRLDNAVGINKANAGTSGTLLFPAGSSVRFSNFEVNARYALTPAISLAGEYTYTDGKINGANPKWNQFGLQADYLLSKRTDVYVQTEFQHVATAGTGVTAFINGVGNASSTDKQVSATVGLRHRF
jgi:GBP family porin